MVLHECMNTVWYKSIDHFFCCFLKGVKTRLWGIEVRCVQKIVLLLNNIPLVQLRKYLSETFSRQNIHKTVLKVQSCENYPIYDLYTVCAIVKTVNLSLTALFSSMLNSIWHLTWLRSVVCIYIFVIVLLYKLYILISNIV